MNMMLLSHSVKKNIMHFCLCLGTDRLKGLFTHMVFSKAGCSEREKEAATYMLFLDLLHDCEEQVHEGNKT